MGRGGDSGLVVASFSPTRPLAGSPMRRFVLHITPLLRRVEVKHFGFTFKFPPKPFNQSGVERRAASIITRRKLARDPAAGIDPKALTTEFNKEPLEDRYFRVTLTVAGRTPKLVFNRVENGGETTEKLTSPSSQFQRRVRRIDIRKHYVRFLVWPDSFEVYIEARKLCSDRDLLAGWKAQTAQAEYSENLATEILRFGPKPKPDPLIGFDLPPGDVSISRLANLCRVALQDVDTTSRSQADRECHWHSEGQP